MPRSHPRSKPSLDAISSRKPSVLLLAGNNSFLLPIPLWQWLASRWREKRPLILLSSWQFNTVWHNTFLSVRWGKTQNKVLRPLTRAWIQLHSWIPKAWYAYDFFFLGAKSALLSTAILMKPPGTGSGRVFLLRTIGQILMLKAFGVKQRIQFSDILLNISFEIGKLPKNLW